MDHPGKISKYVSVLYRYIQSTMAKQLEPLGIGMGQYVYIIAVCHRPGIPQDALNSQLYYNKSSVTRAISQLEERGFLRRETDPRDKRAYRLYPTDKGKAALEVVMDRMGDIIDDLTAGFEAEERAVVEALLERMAGKVVDLRG